MRQPEHPSQTAHGVQIGQGRDKRDRAVHGGEGERSVLNVGGHRGGSSGNASGAGVPACPSLLKSPGRISYRNGYHSQLPGEDVLKKFGREGIGRGGRQGNKISLNIPVLYILIWNLVNILFHNLKTPLNVKRQSRKIKN